MPKLYEDSPKKSAAMFIHLFELSLHGNQLLLHHFLNNLSQDQYVVSPVVWMEECLAPTLLAHIQL